MSHQRWRTLVPLKQIKRCTSVHLSKHLTSLKLKTFKEAFRTGSVTPRKHHKLHAPLPPLAAHEFIVIHNLAGVHVWIMKYQKHSYNTQQQ